MNKFDIEIRENLLQSSRDLLCGNSNEALRDALLAEFGNLKYAFVIKWIPEQDEDVFVVAIPQNHLLTVEISQSKTIKPIVEYADFQQHRKKRLNKENRRKVEVVAKIFKELR